ACGEFAMMSSIPNFAHIRPNCDIGISTSRLCRAFGVGRHFYPGHKGTLSSGLNTHAHQLPCPGSRIRTGKTEDLTGQAGQIMNFPPFEHLPENCQKTARKPEQSAV